MLLDLLIEVGTVVLCGLVMLSLLGAILLSLEAATQDRIAK